MNLGQGIEHFLDHLRVERNVSPRTVASYGHDLAGLVLHVGGPDCDVRRLGSTQLRGFIQSLAARGCRATTQARAVSALRQFFLHLRREGCLTADPAAGLESVRSRRPLPHSLGADWAARLLDTAVDPSPRGLRDRAALELLYGSGLRVSEVCLLKMADVDGAAGLVRPMGKGRKQRTVPLGQAAGVALMRYVNEGRPTLLRGGTSAYVFIGYRCRPLSRMALYNVVRRQARAVGIPQAISPHTLRHAFATHLLQGGADLRAVQEMLGHASVATTEIYTHVAQADLQRSVDTHHPLGKTRCAKPPPRR